MGEFRHLLSVLRLAAKDGRSYIAFPKRKFKYVALLNQLRDLGFVENFEHRGELLIINLKQVYWKSFQNPVRAFEDIETLSGRLRHDRSRKGLAKSQLRQGHFVYAVVTTDRGVVGGFEAAAKKIGGLPLFKIY